MIQKRIIKFCRLRLGMKPIIDYAQSRRKLLGIAELPIRTVFDVGANVGRKARQYRKLFPEAKIYCFEPVPATYERLHQWSCRQNGAVSAFNIALGSKVGETSIHWNQDHWGGSTVLVSSRNAQEDYLELPVRMETLDTVARSLEVRDQIFVKIDVEGFDMEVIKGGANLLARATAVIVEIALPEAPSDGPAFPQFVSVMTELGYLYRGNLTHGFVDGTARHVDAVFIKPPAARPAAA
jgi:FkbM family methyltransferase